MFASDNALSKYADGAVLWNAVEQVEKAKNSQLAREIEVALPVKFTYLPNVSIMRFASLFEDGDEFVKIVINEQ